MKKLSLAFDSLNLRWNPFGEPTAEDMAELAVVEVEQFVERLRSPGFALQYLGEAGRGKSTHLQALHAYFPDMPYVRFPEDGSLPAVPDAPVVFLDETQRMPPRLRKRVFGCKASFVIGTHEDHTAEFRQAGLDCASIRLRGLTPDRLAQIVERRIAWARRGPGPLPSVSPDEITRLIEHYGDNIAAILQQLYEDFQTRSEGAANENPAALG